MYTPHPGAGGPEDWQEDLRAELLAKGDDLDISTGVKDEGGDLPPVSLKGREERKGETLERGELVLNVCYGGRQGREGGALSAEDVSSISRDHATSWQATGPCLTYAEMPAKPTRAISSA